MFRLKTFGGLNLEGASSAPYRRSGQRRRLALLATLAAGRGAPVSRDKLIGWFWPDHDTAAARHALAQAVYEIRRALGEDAIVAGPADDLQLNPAVVASDVALFHAALERGDLAAAADLYHGPFLDGFYVGRAPDFEHWVDGERERLAALATRTLEDLAGEAAAAGDAVRAADWWTRLAMAKPLDARVVLEAMGARVGAGDRAGALQLAARHATECRRALDSGADPAVTALAAELRRGGATPAAAPVAVSAGVRPLGAAPPAPRTLLHIRPRAALVAGAVVLLGGLALSRQLRPAARLPQEVVLGSVSSSDAALGLAIREALRAELEGTVGIRLTTEPVIRETLALMHLPTDGDVPDPVAVEIAQRHGASLAIVGSAEPLGTGASIVVRVIDGGSGRAIATVAAHPAEQSRVVGDVVRLAREVRAQVTGSRVEAGEPLPRVTTSSLSALKSYALARRELGAGNRERAVELAEIALVHDSTFPLAHYLAGDQLWFMDRDRAGARHLRRAFELSATLPPRERLIVEARYRQLVLDQPDSAATTWERLRLAFPDEVNAYEGLSWSYRALGRFADAANASAGALALDPQARLPNVTARLFALLAGGDTAVAAAFAEAQRDIYPWGVGDVALFAALWREDSAAARAALERAFPTGPAHTIHPDVALRWQTAALAVGRLAEGEHAMSVVVRGQRAQEPPRSLIAQARAELELGGSAEHAAALAREAFAWLHDRDLSPPAFARLLEGIADVAARAGDGATLDSAHRMILRLDAGRGLRSYRLAEEAVTGYRAFAAGSYGDAARLAARTAREAYFWRSISPLLLLEADALAAAGDTASARARYRSLRAWPQPGDADYDTWFLVRRIVERAR